MPLDRSFAMRLSGARQELAILSRGGRESDSSSSVNLIARLSRSYENNLSVAPRFDSISGSKRPFGSAVRRLREVRRKQVLLNREHSSARRRRDSGNCFLVRWVQTSRIPFARGRRGLTARPVCLNWILEQWLSTKSETSNSVLRSTRAWIRSGQTTRLRRQNPASDPKFALSPLPYPRGRAR